MQINEIRGVDRKPINRLNKQAMNQRGAVSRIFQTIITSVSLVLVVLFPIFFLDTTPNIFDTNKLLLLSVGTILILTAWLVGMVVKRHYSLTLTPFTLPIVALAVIHLVSSYTSSTSAVEHLMGRGLLFPVLAVLFLILTSAVNQRTTGQRLLYGLVTAGVILSFVAIFQGVGGYVSTAINQIFGTKLSTNANFSPAGSLLAFITLVVPVLTVTISMALIRKDTIEKVLLFLVSAVMAGALTLSIVLAIPGKDTAAVILPYRTGYAIMLETFKQPLTKALLGYGPEAYVNAFSKTRPVSFNLNEQWNVRFGAGSNEVFTLATTTGALGLAAWLWLVGVVVWMLIKGTTGSKTVKLATGVTIFLQLLVPGNSVLIFVTFILLTLWAIELKLAEDSQVRTVVATIQERQEGRQRLMTAAGVIAPVISLILAIGALVLLWPISRIYSAEMVFRRSISGGRDNNAVTVYNLQREAITKNPNLSSYRRAYAVTNLAIANSLARRADLSDQDRNTIVQLIQQAIRDGKVAVNLAPETTANWEVLTTIYQNLINVANNAQQWTIAAYTQAIQTDPINPRLRLQLGGVFYSLNQPEQAIRFFQQAAELKPNWANAFYNLATVYKGKKDQQAALTYLTRAVALLEPDSADYVKAQEELNQLRESLNLEAAEATPSGQLTTPEPLPSPLPEGEITLPAEAAPETQPGEATIPTPPAGTATPVPSPTP